MAWRSALSDEPVTVAFLIALKVSLDWHAAVAIVLEIAEVFERSGSGRRCRRINSWRSRLLDR